MDLKSQEQNAGRMTSSVSDRSDHNPYSPNWLERHIRVPADGLPKFPFFIAGPVLGAVIGIVHVGSMAMVWAYHGFPDFFFRTTEWALVGELANLNEREVRNGSDFSADLGGS